MIPLTVNGEAHEHRGNGTLNALLEELEARPDHVAVLLNDRVVARADRDRVRLREGDRVEVLIFAGGG